MFAVCIKNPDTKIQTYTGHTAQNNKLHQVYNVSRLRIIPSKGLRSNCSMPARAVSRSGMRQYCRLRGPGKRPRVASRGANQIPPVARKGGSGWRIASHESNHPLHRQTTAPVTNPALAGAGAQGAAWAPCKRAIPPTSQPKSCYDFFINNGCVIRQAVLYWYIVIKTWFQE